jgi:hypothetical protein
MQVWKNFNFILVNAIKLAIISSARDKNEDSKSTANLRLQCTYYQSATTQARNDKSVS